MRSRCLRLAALLLLALFFACASEEEKVDDFMERGRQAAEAEQWSEAIIEFRNVLQLEPNNADAHYELAKSYLAARQLRDAYWELHETARLDPANIEARLTYAQFALAAGEVEEALAQADGVLEQEPGSAMALVVRGQSLERLERAPEAEAAYLAAREAAPDESAHLVILASYYQRVGAPEKAEPLLREYTRIDPGFTSHTALGRFLARDAERRPEAEQAFRDALKSTEEDADNRVAAYRNLAGFYHATDRPDSAVEVLEQGIGAVEGKLDLIYLLARLENARGNRERADGLVEEATRKQPGDVRPWLVLSSYRGQQGDLAGALEAANSAIEADPESRDARLRKAELLVDLGYREDDELRIAEGRAIVDAVLATAPADPSGLFVRAKIEMAEGNAAGAKESLQRTVEARPDWAQAHFVLGSAELLTDETGKARASLARSLELDPTLAEARRTLAQVHLALGEYEYAIEQGRLYLRERPGHRSTQILVAQALVRLGRDDEAQALLSAVPDRERDPDTLYALARLRVRQGDLAGARELLLQADEIRPDHPDILRTLLGVERRLGKVDESVRRIERAVAAQPDAARLRLLEGMVALMRNDGAAAERAFRRATELDPDDLSGYEQLAYYYRLTGQVGKTIDTYEEASAARPDSARLHHFLGVLYELDGRPDKAIERYSRAIEADSSLGESMNNLAYLLAERGDDLDRALDLAQEAKALLPESANAADTLGWVLYKRGVPSAAVGYLREAEAGMDPSDDNLGVIRHHLALAYEASGEAEKAVATLERALEALGKQQEAARAAGAQPNDPAWAGEARSMLGRLQSAAS